MHAYATSFSNGYDQLIAFSSSQYSHYFTMNERRQESIIEIELDCQGTWLDVEFDHRTVLVVHLWSEYLL